MANILVAGHGSATTCTEHMGTCSDALAVRVTPQPYTSLPELDRFMNALRSIARS